jgi:hypothetical protein
VTAPIAYPVRVDRRVFVPMADGTRIALTVYLPDAPGDGPFPAVIESLPYRKDDDCTARDWQTYSYLAAQGIAGIRLDIRGTGASTGVIAGEYVAQEQDDNLEVMAWAADQDWCSGNLGMWGISWGGFSALQTAMRRPPQLKAIAPMHATHDRFACDVHYTGGSLHGAEQVDWPPSMISCNALPPDPDIFGQGWFEEWMERLERTPQWHFDWLRHQTRDAFWLHGSPIADYAAITCPTLLIGGWLDGYVDGMLALAEHLDCPTRTVIGPWGHRRPATGVPAPTLDHYDLLARWFGHHLRGDDNGVMEMPPVVVYIQDPSNDTHRVPGRWRAENEWPPADAGLTEWILADLDHGPTVWAGPQWVGIHAPAWDRAEEPVESSTVDDEASVTFQIDPLEEAVEILGTVEVEVNVASDASVGMVAARLVAVSPAGDTVLVSRGNRNLAFPSNLSDPVAIEPGSAVTVRFPLLACSAVIPAGWSLRLALSGADFPVVWPPGGSFTLTFDAARSRLLVPTVPSRPDDRWLDLPEAGSPPATPVESVRSVSERSVDRYEGLTVYRRIVGSTEVQPDRHDLTYSADQEWTVSVADVDPAGMAARAVSAMRLERPGWSVGANGSLDLTTDGEHFHLTIELTATLDDTDVFQRTWRESITRRWA